MPKPVLARIKVKSRSDAEALAFALGDPTVYAFAVVMGTLLGLESDDARRRVVGYLSDVYAKGANNGG